jgi:peptide subunit release factor 1 (eRF1)
MLSFLDQVARMEGEAVSLYLPQGMPPARVTESLEKAFDPTALPSGLVDTIADSKTGAVLFWGTPGKYLVLPPFPVKEAYASDGYHVEPLRSLLGHDFIIALVLVRLGAYSIGVCQGTKVLDSKTGTGLVHARHKKGGSSQARFARHREKQIEYFLGRVCSHVQEHIEPHVPSLDYLVYGGSRTTILSLQKQCTFLGQFEDHVLRILLDIPEPRRAVLEKALRDVWSTTMIEWHEDTD